MCSFDRYYDDWIASWHVSKYDMKSSELMTECPVCGKLVSKEWVDKHIIRMTYLEKTSKLHRSKDHVNYQYSRLINNKLK